MATKVKKARGSLGTKVKTAVKKYSTALKTSYNIGFNDGWESAPRIPNRTGARAAAVKGYDAGIQNRRKASNSNRKYEKAKG